MKEKAILPAVSRRQVMQIGAGLAVAAQTAQGAVHHHAAKPIAVHWLGDAPDADIPAVWGCPWAQGAVSKGTSFRLSAEKGAAVALQSWPLAYWPDGSLKWTGHAAVIPRGNGGLSVAPGASPGPATPVVVSRDGDRIHVGAGGLLLTVPRQSDVLIEAASLDGKVLVRNARLQVLRRDRPDDGEGLTRTERFAGTVENVTVEQAGKVRAVVRYDGHYRSAARNWLPFTVRLSLMAGSGTLRLTHSFVFDGDAAADFIAGMGLSFDVPLPDEWQNRHIRFGGDGKGVWGEAVRNLPGWADRKFAYSKAFRTQLQGGKVPVLAEMDEKSRGQLQSVAAFGDFKLSQLNPDHFTVVKRTTAKSSWLTADHGRRASGLGYVGGVAGGVAFGQEDFWQRHPTALEISGARDDAAKATLWFWSPDAPAMDMRHYDTEAHGLEISYEDVQPGHSTPFGVANTSHAVLHLLPATPSRRDFASLSTRLRTPPVLLADRDGIHAAGVFGQWTLADRSTPMKANIEDKLDGLLGFYEREIDRRQWYGFWNYGDVCHSYDADRHVWRYDVGGYAWSNSELVPDLWFWYSFLRTGKPSLFRMAEAMTRHTSEVDTYHAGPFAMLGSRHNVVHWGCGAKEARISQALLRRIYYYLTADERTGDIMASMVAADTALVGTDPLREILPASQYPTHARSGPDWFALASNWFTAWERSGDPKWRDKILTGMTDLAAMPDGLFSGPAFGYDPKTGHLYDISQGFKSSYHLVTIFGGAELMFEMLPLVNHKAFADAWVRFCQYYNAPEDIRRRDVNPAASDKHFAYSAWHARLTAYAAKIKGDRALGERAWNEVFYGGGQLPSSHNPLKIEKVSPPDVLAETDELPWLGGTNHASQWSLNLIALLALVPDAMPQSLHGVWKDT